MGSSWQGNPVSECQAKALLAGCCSGSLGVASSARRGQSGQRLQEGGGSWRGYMFEKGVVLLGEWSPGRGCT